MTWFADYNYKIRVGMWKNWLDNAAGWSSLLGYESCSLLHKYLVFPMEKPNSVAS